MKLLTYLAAAATASLLAAPSSAATYNYMVGDVDGFGGGIGSDNRSAAEQAATNGAQFTDLSSYYGGQYAFTNDGTVISIRFAIDAFASITSMTFGVFALGIQTNDSDPTTFNQPEDSLVFEGDLVSEFFAGVDQGPSGTGLISGSIAPALFGNALDGVADFEILLNSQGNGSYPEGEPAAFDYFTLSIEGTLKDAQVPLPATAPLLLAALGGAGMVARRRRRR